MVTMQNTAPEPSSHTIAWVVCDDHLIEARPVPRGEVENYLRDRLTELSHDLVTRSFHPRHWSVEFHGRMLGRTPGLLMAYEMPAAKGSLIVDRPGEGRTVHFHDDHTGRVWTVQASETASTPAGLDRWLSHAGFAADSPGAGWNFSTDMYGRLVAPALAGVATAPARAGQPS